MKKHLVFLLAIVLNLPLTVLPAAHSSQTLQELRGKVKAGKKPKLAPDLEELLAQDDQKSLTLGQIRQNRLGSVARKQGKDTPQPTRLKGIALPSQEVPAEEKQSFIVQVDRITPDIVVQEKLALLGGRISHKLDGLVVIEAPRTAIRQIAADAHIKYVSPDRLIESTAYGYVESVSGRADMLKLSGCSKIDGNDVNLAVLDSGVWEKHHSLTDRILTSVDFTGEGLATTDPFGHGTHVASLAVAKPHVAKGAYEGLAPGAKIANLRVLDSRGRGSVSQALKAINWLLTNAAKNKIRVVNLSFGAAALDSYKNDPLCQAVRRLVNNGIVVVVAAGNDGKDSFGKKIYGRIHAPGNEPSAITVGAANDLGTITRTDDRVATFSSRGPTRSSYVDANGVRHYDNLIKPDLIAIGNKLIAAAAEQNYLLRTYPYLDAGVATAANHKQMYMSGTSMAAPVVAGAAALMLQANPTLTPNLIKAVLLYTAQPLKGYNVFEQGAGQVNVAGAVQLAKLMRTDLTLNTPKGTTLLTGALPSSQASVINGETCYWSQAVIADHTFFYGSALMTKWQGIYRLGALLTDGTLVSNGTIWGDSALLTAGVQVAEGPVNVYGNSLAEGTLLAKGVVFADGTLLDDGTLLGGGMMRSDYTLLEDVIRSQSILANGEATRSMPVTVEDRTTVD